MSARQILIELPKLSHAERREIVRRLLELEEDAQMLADCDQRADTNFAFLDALEDEDHAGRGQNASRSSLAGGSRISGQGAPLSDSQRSSVG